MEDFKDKKPSFVAPNYPEKPTWYQDIMYFLLKRFKGAISYSDFYEMWDDDMWQLYRKELELVKVENKESKSGNNEGTTNVPEPELPEEDPEVLDLVSDILD
ncbi:MAG: hypothetical protein K8E24_014315 [Methanobacterium paludis]|nr:hypothetical protein [Methanobacterium paludis]